MRKIVATGLVVVAALGTIAAAQVVAEEDVQTFAGGWHLHPSTCTLHHEDGSGWVFGVTYSGMTADFEIYGASLRDLTPGDATDIDFLIDGASLGEFPAGAYHYDDGTQGWQFGLELGTFDRLRTARRVELRHRGEAAFRLDPVGIAPALDAAQACYMEGAPAWPDGNVACVDENKVDWNEM